MHQHSNFFYSSSLGGNFTYFCCQDFCHMLLGSIFTFHKYLDRHPIIFFSVWLIECPTNFTGDFSVIGCLSKLLKRNLIVQISFLAIQNKEKSLIWPTAAGEGVALLVQVVWQKLLISELLIEIFLNYRACSTCHPISVLNLVSTHVIVQTWQIQSI